MASILVVEDNVSLGQLYTKFLAYTGATVAQTTSCAQTMEYLSTNCAPDIIILDMTLPDGNGVSILNYLHIQPQFADTQTIMISANENYRNANQGFGVEHFFLKPVSLSMLAACVKMLLAQRGNLQQGTLST